jgi:hypothetical protein
MFTISHQQSGFTAISNGKSARIGTATWPYNAHTVDVPAAMTLKS